MSQGKRSVNLIVTVWWRRNCLLGTLSRGQSAVLSDCLDRAHSSRDHVAVRQAKVFQT